MKTALHAEWTKMRTLAGPLWLLIGAVTATVAVGAVAVTLPGRTPTCCAGDTVKAALTGIRCGQAPVAVLAVMVIGGEHGSGMIRTTLTAVPRRATLLTAKAVVLVGAVTAAGTVAVLGSLLAARLTPHGAGRHALSPAHGPALRACAGSVLYLVLIALLSLGVATAVRDSATSTGVVLGLLYVAPVISRTVSDPHWQRLLQRFAPTSAELTFQATAGPAALPVGPWSALGVTAGWATAALLVGGLLLSTRDP